MNNIKSPIVFILLLLIAGCSGDSDTILSGSSAQSLFGGSQPERTSAILSWTPPTQYSDGTPMPAGELSSYRIYLGTNQSSFDRFIEIDATDHMGEYTIEFSSQSLASETEYFLAMTTLSLTGLESAPSQIISFTTP
jgi:hypothetical protein